MIDEIYGAAPSAGSNLFKTLGSALGKINPMIGYGLLSGVGSLFSSLWNQSTGLKQSKDLMDYQYQLQQKAIDAMNAYNHPKAQMERLAEAQLNPNLVYGSGVDGNQSSAASPSIASRSGQMQNPFQDLGQNYAQMRQLRINENMAFQNALESKARRKKYAAETLGILKDNQWKDQTLDTRIKHAAQKLANDVAREDLLGYQSDVAAQQANNLRIVANNLAEETKLIMARTNLTEEQAKTEAFKRWYYSSASSLNLARVSLSKAQAAQAYEMVEYLKKGGQLRAQQIDFQDVDLAAKKIYAQWKKDHPKSALTIEIVKDIVSIMKGMSGIASDVAPIF